MDVFFSQRSEINKQISTRWGNNYEKKTIQSAHFYIRLIELNGRIIEDLREYVYDSLFFIIFQFFMYQKGHPVRSYRRKVDSTIRMTK